MSHHLPRPASAARHVAPGRASSRHRISRQRTLWRLSATGVAVLLLLSVLALTGAPSTAGRQTTASDGTQLTGWWSTTRDGDRKTKHRKPQTADTTTSPTPTTTSTGSTTGSTTTTTTTTTAPTTAPTTTTTDAAAAPAPSGTQSVVGRPFIAYSADSLFRRPLPATTPVSSTSAQGVAFAKANEPFDYLKIRGAQGVGWGIAYAMADCSDPIYRIGSSGNVPKSQQHLRDVGFHAPASVWQNVPDNGDAPFLVIDTCGTSARPAGLSVWGANAVVSGQTVNVSAAGSFSHDSNGLDSRNPASNTALNERSRGVIPDSMAIRVDLLDWAIRNGTGLGHMLEVFWSETDSAAGVFSPMVGAESGNSGYGAEGERFRIKANVNLAARPGCSPTTNPVGLAIARTLQQNGAYIGDNSGSGSGIKTEMNADYPGLTADSLRGCMTWDDIEFLPRGYTP